MNSYEQKAREQIAGVLDCHQVALGHLADEDSELSQLVDDLTALFREETRKSFLNGLKAAKRGDGQSASGGRYPSAVRAGKLARADRELAMERP